MNHKSEQPKFAESDKEVIAAGNVAPGEFDFKPDTIILERFRVMELLGRGGMGSVYKVEDINTSTKYALKFLNKQQTNDASWKRFENEVRAANKLDHPNLIKVHESGLLANGQPFFIMDLIEGESLAEILRRRGRLPLENVLKIFVQVGFALSYAHSNGVIHRDIKPSNIMIQTPGADTTVGSVVKVVDFGIAKLTGQDEFSQQTLTKTGEIFGSPFYMSPEQCMGIGVDHRSDLYSMGCVIYEALTGAPPLVGDTALSTMLKHQSEIALPLREASMGIEFPERIEQIVAKLLAKDIQARYQSAQLLTSHLVSFDSSPLDNFSTPAAQTLSLSDDRPLAKWKLVAIAAGFLFAGILIGYYIPQPGSLPAPDAHDPIGNYSGDSKTPEKEDKNKVSIPATNSESATRILKLASSSEKFSTYTQKQGQRVFHFPQFSIGSIRFKNYSLQTAAGDVISPKKFEGIMFAPIVEFREQPVLFSKFRDDELWFLDLSNRRAIAAFADSRSMSVDPIIPHILHMKSIVILSLEDTTISPEFFSKLETLPNLREFWLARVNVSSDLLAKATYLAKLRVLCLESMQNASAIVEKIGVSKKMKQLIIRDCGIDINDVGKLSDCHSLEILDVRGNAGVSDQCIPLLPDSLVMLCLSNCPITSKSIDSFKRLKHLKQLEVTTTNWKPEDISKLRRALPRVELLVGPQ